MCFIRNGKEFFFCTFVDQCAPAPELLEASGLFFFCTFSLLFLYVSGWNVFVPLFSRTSRAEPVFILFMVGSSFPTLFLHFSNKSVLFLLFFLYFSAGLYFSCTFSALFGFDLPCSFGTPKSSHDLLQTWFPRTPQSTAKVLPKNNP